MDLFFGFDKPVLNEDGLSLLCTLYDDLLVDMYEALLKEENIPYLKKDRSGGGAIRILMGNNPHGTDIYVPAESVERARELLRQKKLVFADQSALLRATTKKKMLKQRFNDQKFLHKHTVVRHFSKRLFWLPYPHTANIKQWQVDEVHRIFKYNQFDDILQEYLLLKEEFERCAI